MGLTLPLFRAPLAFFTVALVAAASLIVVPAAMADTAPLPDGTETTVSSDPLPTVQIDGVVWDQVVIGNTVYAGGSFATARPAGAAAGVNTVPRTNLLAYNLTTGELISSFNHTINGEIKSLAASPDGTRLYIAGSFTQVDGLNRYRVAAFTTATGALASFAPAANSTVNAVAATNTTVYLGGNFTAIGSTSRIRAAAVAASNGAVKPFSPVAEGGRVTGIVVSPDASKVVLGGSFTTLNGSSNPGFGMGAVDATTGALLPWNANNLVRNAGTNASIFSLASDGDSVYGSGYHFGGTGTLEGVFRADWTTGEIVWVEDCHGDTYSVAASTDVIYTASHSHYCGNSGGFPQTSPTWTFQRAMAWSKSVSGNLNTPDPYGYPDVRGVPAPKLLNWWPDINVGTYTGVTQGAWDVAASGKYVLYGGEFTRINNKAQQGLVRFAKPDIAPNNDGPRLAGANFVPSAVSLTSGSVRLSWLANYDRDNQYLTYDVIRNGATSSPVYSTVKGSRIWWDRPTMGWTDTGLTPGQSYTYRLRATDPFGNQSYGDPVSVTVSAATAASAYAQSVVADGASSLWRLGEDSGATVYDWAGFNDAVAGDGVTRGAAGALAGDSNRASVFSGTGTGLAATQTPVQGPDTFAIEAWFNTTTTVGGKIVGFGNANTGNSSNYDRHVYLDPSGRVLFGVYPGAARTVESSPGFNDGQWHHVVANLGPTGMQLYVDGVRVGQRSDTTFGQPYTGYWRIGGDSAWAGANYFSGSIDDVALYNSPLTAQQVNHHLVLSGRESALPTAPPDAYGSAVFASAPQLYWRLGESSGSTAQDASGSRNTGLYSGGVTQGVAGTITGTTNSAARFDGIDGLVSSTKQFTNPQTYSLELWFNSTTTRGGKLIGFGRNQTGSSPSYDRHIYLQDDGRIVFGTYTGQTNTITTAGSFTDGNWHHVVASQGSNGLRLYVDGQLQGTNPATQAEGFDGYWRVGGDNTWGSSSSYVAARIDEVAVYGGVIDAATVLSHFQLGSGSTPNVAPVSAFTATATDLTVALDAGTATDTDGTIVSYAWDFGDGTTGSGATTSHTYASAGTRTVTLTVTDDDGASNATSRSVTAVAPNVAPVASFSSPVVDLTVSADAAASSDSDGTIASFAWTFGDGSTATGSTASHTYSAAGVYTVSLTVTDDDGATDTTSRTVTATAPVIPNSPPTASFSATPTNLSVAVDASASADSDGTVASYSWQFGDGGSEVGKTASHLYGAAGTYTIALTVTDDDGATATTQRSVTVAASPANPALATDTFGRTVTGGLGSAAIGGAWSLSGSASNFSVDGQTARLRSATAGANLNAFLTGASSTDTEVRVTTSLAQASTGGGTYVSVFGRRVGTADYRARVVVSATGAVTLQLLQTGTTLQSVKVPGFTYVTGDRLDVRLQVVGTSPTTIRAKVWKSGTTEPATWTASATDATPALQQAGHIGIGSYVSASSTTLPLVTTFDDLWAGSTSATPPVDPPANVAPVAAFASSTSGLVLSVNGSGSSDPDGSIASYAWSFGDGTTATGITAAHTFAAAGTYPVTLTVTDNGGATGTLVQSIAVGPLPGNQVLAADSFSRSTTTGLGTADVGGAWTLSSGASNYSVSGTAARYRAATAGALIEAYLASVSSTTTDVGATVSLSQRPVAASTYASLIGRRVGTQDYRARVVISSTGQITLQLQRNNSTMVAGVLSGLTYSPGDLLAIRLQVTGTNPTTIRAKAWIAGTPEPTDWRVTTTDSLATLQSPGSVGLGSYLAAGATSLPFTTSFDDFSAIIP